MPAQPDPQLVADVDAIYHGPTRFNDPTEPPAYGSAPPVAQPGRPPMSSKAVDDSVRMITFGGMTLLVCGGASLVMVASDFADPTVIGMICAAPAVVALPILAIARVLRGARPAPDVHQHYYGNVTHQTTHSSNTGLWARTDNRQ